MTESEIICINMYPTRQEAQVAQSALTAAGITSLILADDAGGAYPFPFSTSASGVKLMIKKSEEKKAKGILSL